MKFYRQEFDNSHPVIFLQLNFSELVGFLDFQETKKTNFESWIVGFPRNQLFFSESWILGLTKKPTLKLDSWISAKNQQTNMKVGLLDFREKITFLGFLDFHEKPTNQV